MTQPKITPSAEFQLTASRQDVIRMLAAQFSHMTEDEARAALARLHNPVLSNNELLEQFEIFHFDAPIVHVIRKSDGARGTMAYIDAPRFYFAFEPEENNDARTA